MLAELSHALKFCMTFKYTFMRDFFWGAGGGEYRSPFDQMHFIDVFSLKQNVKDPSRPHKGRTCKTMGKNQNTNFS